MKARALTALLCSLALVGALPCQDVNLHNPVPVRVESVWYGYRLNPRVLEVGCYIFGEEYTSLRLTGGTPHEQALLLCSFEPAVLPMRFGYLLVSPYCFVAHGVFNSEGVFEFPINLGAQELRGLTLYLQGMDATEAGAPPELSWGLALRFAEGNAQPVLPYRGPPVQAFFCRDVLEEVPILHSLLVRFEAAQSYELSVEAIVKPPCHSKVLVFATMESIGGPFGPNVWHRKAVELAKREVPPVVELWVKTEYGYGGEYELAAVIQTAY